MVSIMNEKLNSLWEKNKFLFVLLLPVVLLLFFKDALLALLINSIRRTSNGSKIADEKLKSDSNQLDSDADRTKAEADSLEKKIKDRTTDDVSEDWHLK